MSQYNLVDTPWIGVQLTNYTRTKVSLRECFTRKDIARLSCDSPRQDTAILRLLLAVAHAAIDLETHQEWENLIAQGLPVEQITDYLDTWYERFFLFDDAYPFLQSATLATNGTTATDSLIEPTDPFYTGRNHTRHPHLSADRAARGLVTLMCFDVGGIHSGAIGDPKAPSGRGYPWGVSYVGQLALFYPAGQTLRQTIALNLCSRTGMGLELSPQGWQMRPVWEEESPTAQRQCYSVVDLPKNDPSHPEGGIGPARLMIWPSRRLRLIGGPDQVTGLINAYGDRLRAPGMEKEEPMSMWYMPPQSRGVFLPAKTLSAKGICDGLLRLIFAQAGANAPYTDVDHGKDDLRFTLSPVLTRAIRAHQDGLLDGKLTVICDGVGYDKMDGSVVKDAWSHAIDLPHQAIATPHQADQAWHDVKMRANIASAIHFYTNSGLYYLTPPDQKIILDEGNGDLFYTIQARTQDELVSLLNHIGSPSYDRAVDRWKKCLRSISDDYTEKAEHRASSSRPYARWQSDAGKDFRDATRIFQHQMNKLACAITAILNGEHIDLTPPKKEEKTMRPKRMKTD